MSFSSCSFHFFCSDSKSDKELVIRKSKFAKKEIAYDLHIAKYSDDYQIKMTRNCVYRLPKDICWKLHVPTKNNWFKIVRTYMRNEFHNISISKSQTSNPLIKQRFAWRMLKGVASRQSKRKIELSRQSKYKYRFSNVKCPP